MSQSKSPIICDSCGTDLTYAGNSVDYRLALVSQVMPSKGGVVTDMMIYPDIDETKHFCNVRCLGRWLQVAA